MSRGSHGEISVEFTFDAGHRIVGHKGKCARLHGHTYRIRVTASGSIREPGFIVDFGDIKELVNEWDHRMILWDQDPLRLADDLGGVGLIDTQHGITRVSFNPTAEHMAQYLADVIRLKFNLTSVMVELWETPKSMARYISSVAHD